MVNSSLEIPCQASSSAAVMARFFFEVIPDFIKCQKYNLLLFLIYFIAREFEAKMYSEVRCQDHKYCAKEELKMKNSYLILN